MQHIVDFLLKLREQIIAAFETLEPSSKFQRKPWQHTTGGGGEIALLRGDIFEKAAVNWSGVRGPHFPMQDGEGAFFATGISLITHMQNPHAPTVHMNIRYIKTEKKEWFGGGYDLTPMGFFYEEDKKHFHKSAQKASGNYYSEWKKNASEYFYLPHRKKRGGWRNILRPLRNRQLCCRSCHLAKHRQHISKRHPPHLSKKNHPALHPGGKRPTKPSPRPLCRIQPPL